MISRPPGCPRRTDSAKRSASLVVVWPGIGGSLGSTTTSTSAGPGCANAADNTSSVLCGSSRVKAPAPQARATAAKSMGCSSTPNSGLPSMTICSHLICPRALFLMMITLTGSWYFTRVAISPIIMVKTAVAAESHYLPSRKSDGRPHRIGQAVAHGGEPARGGELHAAAHAEITCRTGRHRSGIAADNRVVGEVLVDAFSDELRRDRLVPAVGALQ